MVYDIYSEFKCVTDNILCHLSLYMFLHVLSHIQSYVSFNVRPLSLRAISHRTGLRRRLREPGAPLTGLAGNYVPHGQDRPFYNDITPLRGTLWDSVGIYSHTAIDTCMGTGIKQAGDVVEHTVYKRS